MNKRERNRDYIIDVLRTLGTLLVILDHCDPPYAIKTFCLFDVPLLVFVSGLSLSVSNVVFSSIRDYFAYIFKRIKRLALPTWITIVLVVLVNLLMRKVGLTTQGLNISEIIRSFLFLQKSIGYVWIVRVYLLIALSTPLYVYINRKIKSDLLYFLLNCLIISIYYLVLIFVNEPPLLIKSILCYLIPYGFIFALGLRGKKSYVNLFIVSGAALFVSIGFLLLKSPELYLADVKYPPLLSFVVHGVLWSIIITILLKTIESSLILHPFKVLIWFSKCSFDIYLAHILIILIVNWCNIEIHWLILWFGVIGLSACCVLLKNWIINKTVSAYRSKHSQS